MQGLAVHHPPGGAGGEVTLATADCFGRGLLARLRLRGGQPAEVLASQRMLPAGGPR